MLKYDWSSRRRGVFLWPLGDDRRKPFPKDFDPGADVFMAFQSDDPHTYKVDAFGGLVIGAYVLKTRDMREPAWEMVSDDEYARFASRFCAPPDRDRSAAALLAHGAGYSSFDLMRTGDAFRIVEMNTCGVGTGLWDDWPGAICRGLQPSAHQDAGLTSIKFRSIATCVRRPVCCGNDRQVDPCCPGAQPG